MASHSSNTGGGETAGLLGQQSALAGKQAQEEQRGRDRVLMVRETEREGREAKVSFENSRGSGKEEEKGKRGGKHNGKGERETVNSRREEEE